MPEDQKYKLGHPWNGMDRWECLECPFDTIELWRMENHIELMHTLPPAPVIADIVLADRFGNIIGNHEVTADETEEVS